MPFTLKMPKLSPTMDSGVIVKWHKNEHEFVEEGQLLLEVATDKATVEYFALDGGWLAKILAKEGSDAAVGSPIAIFTSSSHESIEGFEYELPIQKTQPILEKENELPLIEKQVVVEKKPHTPTIAPLAPLSHYQFSFKEGDREESYVRASPLARRCAEQRGVDLSSVQGSGPAGRIIEKDVEKAVPLSYSYFRKGDTLHIPPGTYDVIPLSFMRKTIAKRLQESKTTIPHFYITSDINAAPLIALRNQLKESEISISVNDFVIRAAAIALRKHPEVNSGFYAETESILRFKTIDISVAVSVQEGLLTPIIRHADCKNCVEISAEIKALVKRAKEGSLKSEEYMGGSFSVTNLGMYGVEQFQAIINPPQAAILAVGAIRAVPVVENGAIVSGSRMTFTLSVDHRVIDGVQAALFLQTLKKLMENPGVLVI